MLASLLRPGEMDPVGNPMCWHIDEFWVAGKTLSRPINEYISAEGIMKSDLLIEGPLRSRED